MSSTTSTLASTHARSDLICFSHLRWNFAFQRPNHLMSLCSMRRRVFFFEEPISAADEGSSRVDVSEVEPQLLVAVPRPAPGQDANEGAREALRELCARYGIERPIVWFYTPMALEFARELPARLTVYDCVAELSTGRAAPRALPRLERELFARADLVFTSGRNLCRAKQSSHHAVFHFPSGVDVAHYWRARAVREEPPDQVGIPHPRLGFAGVIDEHIDVELLDAVATARPEWQLVLVGPMVRGDSARLPELPNIHYLGRKPYAELPVYLGGWDVALIPLMLNEATRFVSPTNTLEYLAGGKPVVSTPVPEVVSPYAERGLVRVAQGAEAFVESIDKALSEGGLGTKRARVDELIATASWVTTWAQIAALMDQLLLRKHEEENPPSRRARSGKAAGEGAGFGATGADSGEVTSGEVTSGEVSTSAVDSSEAASAGEDSGVQPTEPQTA